MSRNAKLQTREPQRHEAVRATMATCRQLILMSASHQKPTPRFQVTTHDVLDERSSYQGTAIPEPSHGNQESETSIREGIRAQRQLAPTDDGAGLSGQILRGQERRSSTADKSGGRRANCVEATSDRAACSASGHVCSLRNKDAFQNQSLEQQPTLQSSTR